VSHVSQVGCRMTDDAELADGAGEARQAGLIAQNARSCKMHDCTYFR